MAAAADRSTRSLPAAHLPELGGRDYSAAIDAAPASQRSRSASARVASACFRAKVLLPRSLFTLGGGAARGGNSPKLTFIGWKLREPPSPPLLRCPPVM